jgi:hypothetical protein
LFTQDFEIEVDQGLNRKVVDLPSLYNFYKGHMDFSQPIVHNLHAKMAVSWAPMNSDQKR